MKSLHNVLKDKIIRKYNLKNKEVSFIPYWQIEKYGYFLSKGKQIITSNSIKNLINSERKLKNLYVFWIIQIETKLKSSLEDIINLHGKKKQKYQVEFYSKNYISNIIHKKVIKNLNLAKNKYIKENPKSAIYMMKKYNHIPFSTYIKYMSFGSVIFICSNLKKILQEKIFQKIKINSNFIPALQLLRELRNLSTHDRSVLDYQSISYALPSNVISAAISTYIHKSQKNKNIWNKNLIAALVIIKLLLTKTQFKSFSDEYTNICKNISKKLGKDNIIYYRLSGGNIKTMDELVKINSSKLMQHNKISRYNLKELRNYQHNETGKYINFKTKYEAIKFIVELSYY